MQWILNRLRNAGILFVDATSILTDPAPVVIFGHLDAITVLSRNLASKGIYPAVDPFNSTSKLLDPSYIKPEHYHLATNVKIILNRYKELQDLIAILALEVLSNSDRVLVNRARKFCWKE